MIQLTKSFIAEFGDYSSDEHGSDYLDGFKVIPEQSASFLKSVAELHKLHKGQSPAEAEYNFLEQAKKLELYGVDLYPAKVSVINLKAIEKQRTQRWNT